MPTTHAHRPQQVAPSVPFMPLTFTVKVMHAEAMDAQEVPMWIAVSDALHLATEAPTFAELRERVWEILPDMLEANRMGLGVEDINLVFQYEDVATALA